MSLTEIQALIKDRNLESRPLGNGDAMMRELTWDDQWIGYDDESTILQKVNYANSHCFGGTMLWSVDLASGNGQKDTPAITSDNTCGPKNGLVCPPNNCCSALGVSVRSL